MQHDNGPSMRKRESLSLVNCVASVCGSFESYIAWAELLEDTKLLLQWQMDHATMAELLMEQKTSQRPKLFLKQIRFQLLKIAPRFTCKQAFSHVSNNPQATPGLG